MFQFQPSISEGDALKKRIDSKSTDSVTEQPENLGVVDVSEDAPEAEPAIEESITEPVTEELEQEEAEQPEDDQDDLYVEYKGRDINLKAIEEWEQGHLRQSDYTRKTQAHAQEVETFNAEREKFNAKQSELNDKIAQLDAIISEETPSDETLAEWREYEPEKLLDYQERKAKRKELLDSSKAIKPTSNVDVTAETAKLWQANPQWLDNGKQTQAFTDDVNLMQKYAAKHGYSNEDISGTTSARELQTLINAAKYEELSKSNAAIEKKVRKAPVSTKPKAQAKSSITSDIAALEKKVRQTGSEQDFVKLRQLKRQLNK